MGLRRVFKASFWLLGVFALSLICAEPILAQDLTVGDLQGMAVTATVKYRGTFAREKGSGPGNITHTYRIRIGPDDKIQTAHTRNVEAITPVGPKHSSLSRNFSGQIGMPAQGGAGNFLWLLDKNELVLLRTLDIGGFKTTIAFSKTDKGMTCKVTAPYLKESGAGAGKTDSAAGGKVRIIAMQQVSSTCSVSKT
jgi:hypothetical protein